MVLNVDILNNTLTEQLKMNILSYLYFSYRNSSKFYEINNEIKKYNCNKLLELYNNYDITMVTYFILKYFVYDKDKSEFLEIDYTVLTKNSSFQKKEMFRIFKKLRIIDILRIIKYVKSDNKASHYYND